MRCQVDSSPGGTSERVSSDGCGPCWSWPGLIDEDAVDGPRIAGRASAKNSANVVPKGTPGGHRRLDGAQVHLVGAPAMTTGQILLLLGSGGLSFHCKS